MPSSQTPQQRAAREEAAWRLRVAGKTEYEIAAELGMSQPGVHRLLERVEKRVIAESKQLVLRLKAREHGVLEMVRREALAGYERSKRPRGKSVTTAVPNQPGQATSVQATKIVRESQDSDGDPAWLAVLLQTHDRMATLWGLQSPRKVEIPREPDPMEALSNAELLLEMEREMEDERRKLLGDGAQGGADV
jgi:DNA-binding CsgD family transcriptional regulator